MTFRKKKNPPIIVVGSLEAVQHKIDFEGNQTTTMSASASRTYENQNDQQLDELHSKLRTLRSVSLLLASSTALPDAPFIQVTIDIHDDTQRQNLDLDNTVCL